MAEITLHGTAIQTCGDLPQKGSTAPEGGTLISTDLKEMSLASFAEKTKLIYTIPSIDTPVCEDSSAKFCEHAAERPHAAFLFVSADLPFAHSRFFGEKAENVHPLSLMRSKQFSEDYGVLITTGSLAGLCARAVIVLNAGNEVLYTELVPEIGNAPDYDPALRALDSI